MTTLPDSNVLPNGLIKAGNNRYIKPLSNGLIFYSYSVPVIAIIDSRVYKTDQFYSITTSRHINSFLFELDCDNPEVVSQSIINWYAN